MSENQSAQANVKTFDELPDSIKTEALTVNNGIAPDEPTGYIEVNKDAFARDFTKAQSEREGAIEELFKLLEPPPDEPRLKPIHLTLDTDEYGLICHALLNECKKRYTHRHAKLMKKIAEAGM